MLKYNEILSNVHKIEGANLQSFKAPQRWCRRNNVQVQHYQKYNKILSNVHKKGGAHLQCVNNNYTKLKEKNCNTVGVKDYTNQTPLSISDEKECLSATLLKNEKLFIIFAQNRKYTSSGWAILCQEPS